MNERTLRAAEVSAGDVLPPLEIPVTTRLVVAAALASRDFQDVHHDPAAARARGAQDVFMNILTTNGLVGRFVTDWAGPEALLRKVAIRLGVPAYPGDTLRLTGTVTQVDPRTGAVTVSLRGANGDGDHVNGTVELELPGGNP